MVRQINTYGDPVLNTQCIQCKPRDKKSFLTDVTEDIEQVWPDELVELVQDLKDTAMSNAENTLGLAAPQIWWKNTPCPAVFVVRTNTGTPTSPIYAFTELINPTIKTSGKSIKLEEGCLSLPGYTKQIKRKLNVTVAYQLINSLEVYHSKLFGKHDMNAIVIQHEYDHLIGKLINT